MKNYKSGITIALSLITTLAIAQEPGMHIGANAGYVDTSPGSGGVAGGLNIGYGFNEIAGLDIEYAHVSGGASSDLFSAFVTLTSTGDTYFKGKIGGTTASGTKADGTSGSLGIGVGTKYSEDWVVEFDLNMYASDFGGANLLIKYNF